MNSVVYQYKVKYIIFISFRLVLHDGFKDVLGWNDPENLNVNTDLVQYLENQTGYHANHSVAIVIDSLSPLILHRPAPYTCQVLSKLTRSKIKSKFKPLTFSLLVTTANFFYPDQDIQNVGPCLDPNCLII